MAPKEKLQKRIRELISKPKNVDYDEVEWVMNQLGAVSRKSRHGVMFSLPGCKNPLMLNQHNDGKKHLPPYCIADFRDRMVELGLYGLEEDHEEN